MTEPITTAQPAIVRKDAMRIVGFARVFTWDTMGEIPAMWQQAGPWIEETTRSMTSESFGAMYIPDAGSGDFGYLAGINVGSDFELAVGLSEISVPATVWAIFPHNGELSDWPKTIDYAMRQWLPSSGRRGLNPVAGTLTVAERYGPGFDPHSGKGDMECWVPLSQ